MHLFCVSCFSLLASRTHVPFSFVFPLAFFLLHVCKFHCGRGVLGLTAVSHCLLQSSPVRCSRAHVSSCGPASVLRCLCSRISLTAWSFACFPPFVFSFSAGVGGGSKFFARMSFESRFVRLSGASEPMLSFRLLLLSRSSAIAAPVPFFCSSCSYFPRSLLYCFQNCIILLSFYCTCIVRYAFFFVSFGFLVIRWVRAFKASLPSPVLVFSLPPSLRSRSSFPFSRLEVVRRSVVSFVLLGSPFRFVLRLFDHLLVAFSGTSPCPPSLSFSSGLFRSFVYSFVPFNLLVRSAARSGGRVRLLRSFVPLSVVQRLRGVCGMQSVVVVVDGAVHVRQSWCVRHVLRQFDGLVVAAGGFDGRVGVGVDGLW